MTSRVVETAALIIKTFCDEHSCDDCPFAYYTSDDMLGQWCKLTSEQVVPKDWRLTNGEPEEISACYKEIKSKAEEIS